MKTILILIILGLVTGCSGHSYVNPADGQDIREAEEIIHEEDKNGNPDEKENNDIEDEVIDYDGLKETILEKYKDTSPKAWGENIEGVIREIDSDEKIVALTFDACNGSPDSYDEDLIEFLIEEEIPATLFIGGQWIKANQESFIYLANNPLFEIANHGYHHKPLSVTGQAAYNIKGTKSLEEAFDEVYRNQVLIKELTGDYPKYFRSGTAYYDDIGVKIVEEMGLKAVNYNVLGDAGGTFNKKQIVKTFESAKEGSIFLFHMNQPKSDISEGVREGLMILKEKGFDFVQLGQYDELLK